MRDNIDLTHEELEQFDQQVQFRILLEAIFQVLTQDLCPRNVQGLGEVICGKVRSWHEELPLGAS